MGSGQWVPNGQWAVGVDVARALQVKRTGTFCRSLFPWAMGKKKSNVLRETLTQNRSCWVDWSHSGCLCLFLCLFSLTSWLGGRSWGEDTDCSYLTPRLAQRLRPPLPGCYVQLKQAPNHTNRQTVTQSLVTKQTAVQSRINGHTKS